MTPAYTSSNRPTIGKNEWQSHHPFYSAVPSSMNIINLKRSLTLAFSEHLRAPWLPLLLVLATCTLIPVLLHNSPPRCADLTSLVRISFTSALDGCIQDARVLQLQHTNRGIRLGHATPVCLLHPTCYHYNQ